MTVKQKAKDLVDDYFMLIASRSGNNVMSDNAEDEFTQIPYRLAIKCALHQCDQMIEYGSGDVDIEYEEGFIMPMGGITFWTKVRKEIEALA